MSGEMSSTLMARSAFLFIAGAFFLKGPPLLKNVTNENFGDPVFGSHLEFLKLTLTF